MTQAEYARRRGVSKQYIGKLVAEGLVVLNDDQTVNVEASDAALGGKVQAAAGKTPKTLAEARYVDMMLRIRERQLDLHIKEQSLVSVESVKLLWADIGAALQASLMQIPDRLCVEFSAATNPREIRARLAEELTHSLKLAASSPLPSLSKQ